MKPTLLRIPQIPPTLLTLLFVICTCQASPTLSTKLARRDGDWSAGKVAGVAIAIFLVVALMISIPAFLAWRIERRQAAEDDRQDARAY